MPYRTTQQVAAQIGIRKVWIILLVSRHHHLKPARMFGPNYVWTDTEIAALRAHFVALMGRRAPVRNAFARGSAGAQADTQRDA